jgi:hypothetical protein
MYRPSDEEVQAIYARIDAVEAAQAQMREEALSSEKLETLQDPEFIVDGMLDIETLCRLVGPTNQGKTFVSIDLACCVATGRSWHGHAVKKAPVIYMVGEGARGFKQRIRAWEQRYNGGQKIPESQLLVMPRAIRVLDEKDWDSWEEVCAAYGAGLIVLDTQSRVTSGINENDNSAMNLFVEKCEQLRDITGACVLLVHHTGKDENSGGRGASVVAGAITTELRVKKLDKGSGSLVIKTDKQRDRAFADDIVLRFEECGSSVVMVSDTTEAAWLDEPLPDELVSAYRGKFMPTGSGESLLLQLARVMKHADRPLSQSAAMKAARVTRGTGGGHSSAARAFRELRTAGWLLASEEDPEEYFWAK